MKRFSLFFAAALAVFALSSRLSAATHEKPAEPERVAHGAQVDLTDYLVPGKTVIFDFTSKYCPPCQAIAPRLHKLHADRADIVVVEIDINRPGIKGIDWKSPTAAQFQLESIPHFKIYGPDGKLQAEGAPARSMVNKWLE